MEGQCLVVVDATLHPESRTEETQRSIKPSSSSSSSSTSPKSKSTAALLVLTLCLASAAAAVLFFNNHSNKGPHQEDDFDLRHTLRQISNEHVRAAIHLKGEYNAELSSLQWKENVDQYHAQGGLTLQDNEIVIPRNGLYFVYSQASFRVSCSSRANDDDDDEDDVDATSQPLVHLSHIVERWSRSYGNPEDAKVYHPILHSVRTACQRTVSDSPEEDGRWFSSIYMGAVFNLEEGDRLKTETDSKLLPDLEDEAGKTFFGVFAL